MLVRLCQDKFQSAQKRQFKKNNFNLFSKNRKKFKLNYEEWAARRREKYEVERSREKTEEKERSYIDIQVNGQKKERLWFKEGEKMSDHMDTDLFVIKKDGGRIKDT